MKNLCFALCVVLVLNTKQAFGAEGGMPQLNPEFWGITNILVNINFFQPLHNYVENIFT